MILGSSTVDSMPTDKSKGWEALRLQILSGSQSLESNSAVQRSADLSCYGSKRLFAGLIYTA